MESLRLLPPVPLTVRMTMKDDVVDGILVPKGTLLTIPVGPYLPLLGSLTLILRDKIRIVNTWKAIWGEDAEEYISFIIFCLIADPW